METFNYFTSHHSEYNRHKSYGNPSEILENPNATLWTITETHALFAICPEGKDVYDTKQTPFTFIGQYQNSEELAVVTHQTLNQVCPITHFFLLL